MSPVRPHVFCRILLCLISALLGSSCGVSPASPGDFEWNPIMIASPTEPVRSAQSIRYSFTISLHNPDVADQVIVRPIECTVLGSDGTTYGSARQPFLSILGPGNSLGGAIGVFVDTNLTRPPATKYTCSTSYNV